MEFFTIVIIAIVLTITGIYGPCLLVAYYTDIKPAKERDIWCVIKCLKDMDYTEISPNMTYIDAEYYKIGAECGGRIRAKIRPRLTNGQNLIMSCRWFLSYCNIKNLPKECTVPSPYEILNVPDIGITITEKKT